MRRPRSRRRSCHRSLSSLCRKRLATARRTVWIFLQALGDKPADRNRKRYDHDEDDDRYRASSLVTSSLHRMRSSVISAVSMACGPTMPRSIPAVQSHPLSQHGSLMANGVIDAPQRPSREYLPDRPPYRPRDRPLELSQWPQHHRGYQAPIQESHQGHPAVRRSDRSDDRPPA